MSVTRIIVKPELFSALATRAVAIGVSTTTYINMMLALTLDARCPVRTAARAAPPANVVSKPSTHARADRPGNLVMSVDDYFNMPDD